MPDEAQNQHSELVEIVGNALAQSCEGYFTQRQDAEAAFESLVEQLETLRNALEEILDRPYGELDEHDMRSIAHAALNPALEPRT